MVELAERDSNEAGKGELKGLMRFKADQVPERDKEDSQG